MKLCIPFMTLTLALPVLSYAHNYQSQSAPLSGEHYTSMVVFGDSLSDASADGTLTKGNNTAVNTKEAYFNVTDHKQVTVYTSHGAPISNNGYQAKALLWDNDILSILQQKGLVETTTQLMPAFNPTQAHAAAEMNLSYAFASAETGDNYLNDISATSPYPPYDVNCTQPGLKQAGENCVPGVLKQIDLYLAGHKTDPTLNQRLYFIFAGGNDLFNNISKLIDKSGKHSYVSENLINAVKALHAAGIDKHHIVLFGIPEIAKAPAASAFLADNATFEDLFNDMLIATENAAIKLTTQDEATWYDVGPIFHQVTSSVYTFNDPFNPSQQYTIDYLGGSKKQADGKYYALDCATTAAAPTDYTAQFTTCAQSNKDADAFFNDKHPSAIMHLALANDIYTHLFKS